MNNEDESVGITTVWTYLRQYEHICGGTATWLTYQGQYCRTLIWLSHRSSLWQHPGWLINLPQTKHVQVFISITVLGHFIAPGCLCLWLVGSGERAGPNSHSNTYGTHTNRKESTDPGIVTHSQNELSEEVFDQQRKEHDGGSWRQASFFFK